MVKWLAVVNSVMNLRLFRNFLTSWGTISFSRRTVRRGVRLCACAFVFVCKNKTYSVPLETVPWIIPTSGNFYKAVFICGMWHYASVHSWITRKAPMSTDPILIPTTNLLADSCQVFYRTRSKFTYTVQLTLNWGGGIQNFGEEIASRESWLRWKWEGTIIIKYIAKCVFMMRTELNWRGAVSIVKVTW